MVPGWSKARGVAQWHQQLLLARWSGGSAVGRGRGDHAGTAAAWQLWKNHPFLGTKNNVWPTFWGLDTWWIHLQLGIPLDAWPNIFFWDGFGVRKGGPVFIDKTRVSGTPPHIPLLRPACQLCFSSVWLLSKHNSTDRKDLPHELPQSGPARVLQELSAHQGGQPLHRRDAGAGGRRPGEQFAFFDISTSCLGVEYGKKNQPWFWNHKFQRKKWVVQTDRDVVVRDQRRNQWPCNLAAWMTRPMPLMLLDPWVLCRRSRHFQMVGSGVIKCLNQRNMCFDIKQKAIFGYIWCLFVVFFRNGIEAFAIALSVFDDRVYEALRIYYWNAVATLGRSNKQWKWPWSKKKMEKEFITLTLHGVDDQWIHGFFCLYGCGLVRPEGTPGSLAMRHLGHSHVRSNLFLFLWENHIRF